VTVSQFRKAFPAFASVPDLDVKREIKASARKLLEHFPTPALRKAMVPYRDELLGNAVAHRLSTSPHPRIAYGQRFLYLRELAEAAERKRTPR